MTPITLLEGKFYATEFRKHNISVCSLTKRAYYLQPFFAWSTRESYVGLHALAYLCSLMIKLGGNVLSILNSISRSRIVNIFTVKITKAIDVKTRDGRNEPSTSRSNSPSDPRGCRSVKQNKKLTKTAPAFSVLSEEAF